MGGGHGPVDYGSLGTGRVVHADPLHAMASWEKSLGRKASEVDKGAWAEFAARLFIPDDTVERLWKGRGKLKEAVVELRSVLEGSGGSGGSFGNPVGSWGGYFVPTHNTLSTPMNTGADPKPAKSTKRSVPDQAPGFPFHTAAAEAVWKGVRELVKKGVTELTYVQILGKAFSASGVKGYEITPEDGRMLDLAVHWLVNGMRSDVPAGVPTSSGIGGPFRSTGYGHHLAGKGAP